MCFVPSLLLPLPPLCGSVRRVLYFTGTNLNINLKYAPVPGFIPMPSPKLQKILHTHTLVHSLWRTKVSQMCEAAYKTIKQMKHSRSSSNCHLASSSISFFYSCWRQASAG